MIICVAAYALAACHDNSSDTGSSSSSSSHSATANSTGNSSRTATVSTPSAGTATAANAAASSAALSCGASVVTINSKLGVASTIDANVSGDDLTRTFAIGSKFSVTFDIHSSQTDSLAWQIVNFAGAAVATGTVPVATGSSSAQLPCTANLPGYFTVTADLKKSGAVLPRKGSRPQGFASFGVLPDFSALLPAPSATSLKSHWFGLQGTNYVDSGKLDVGSGLQPVNQNLGSSMAIDSGSWSQLEPDYAGQYNPASTVLDLGFEQGNLDRMVRLDGIPSWASSAPSTSDIGSYAPKSYGEFQNFASQVALANARLSKEYIPSQHVNYYQVTWEPDTGNVDKWRGTDAEFVALYKAAWHGVHSTDSAAAVIGPATSTLKASVSWLSRLAPLGLSQYLDAVSIHGYPSAGGPYSSNPPEAFGLPQQMQELRHTMATLLPAKTKLLVTETGIAYPPGSRYTATFPTADALRQHAETVVRTHLILLGEGADASFLFYSADYSTEIGFGLYFNLAMSTADFGSPQISPKPAAMAAATMTRLLDKTTTLGALTEMPNSSYGYSFQYGDGTHALTALWAHDAAFNASVPYGFAVDAADSSGSVTVIDAMGEASTQSYSNGILQLTLTEMPVYVLSSNIAAISAEVRAPEGY